VISQRGDNNLVAINLSGEYLYEGDNLGNYIYSSKWSYLHGNQDEYGIALIKSSETIFIVNSSLDTITSYTLSETPRISHDIKDESIYFGNLDEDYVDEIYIVDDTESIHKIIPSPCELYLNDTETSHMMSYNSSSGLYYFNTTLSEGSNYTVICWESSRGYENLSYSGKLGDLDDTDAPLWNLPMVNWSNYNTTAVHLNNNATDDTAISTYFINDTSRFTIDSNGLIINNSVIAVGNYSINISVNDTSNNVNSTFINIEITTAPITACPSGTNEICTIDCSLNCYIDSETTCNQLDLYGSGYFIVTSDFYFNNITIPNTCYIDVVSGGNLYPKLE